MTTKTTNKFSPEVRERAVRMVQEHAGEYPTRWAAVQSIAAKIGCTAQTLHEWTKKVEVDGGNRKGATSLSIIMIGFGFCIMNVDSIAAAIVRNFT